MVKPVPIYPYNFFLEVYPYNFLLEVYPFKLLFVFLRFIVWQNKQMTGLLISDIIFKFIIHQCVASWITPYVLLRKPSFWIPDPQKNPIYFVIQPSPIKWFGRYREGNIFSIWSYVILFCRGNYPKFPHNDI